MDDPAFIQMKTTLNPNANVMDYRKIRAMIDEELLKFLAEVLEEIGPVRFVCLTADMWASCHQSWIGMTLHWIDIKTLLRRQAPVCCKQFIGELLLVTPIACKQFYL